MAGLNDNLNGIICINKPTGFTSFDVIAKLRGILRLKRLGHAGTLDPMATGVLPVLVGKATRACDIMPDHDKEYEAGFRLGAASDTQDSFGTITEKGSFAGITAEKITAALEPFKGKILQLPPMYSAVSVNGQRLYELARKGIVVERTPREITVFTLELCSYDKTIGEGRLKISCSKGTYIRTLINDIGEALGCGAVMSSLVRTKACGFSLADCTTIEELQRLADSGASAEGKLCPIDRVFRKLCPIMLDEKQEKLYRCGVKLERDRLKYTHSEKNLYRIIGADGGFIGTAYFDGNTLRVDKNF